MKHFALSFGFLCALSGAPAWGGSSTSTQSTATPQPSTTCQTSKGSLCKPQGVTDEIVPEYYNVPSKTKHIYYKKPPVKPITTHIVHHVPTPVYGREMIVEKVQGGYYQGAPVATCCHGRIVQSRPVVHSAPITQARRTIHVPTNHYARRVTPCQSRHPAQSHTRTHTSRPCR